MSYNWHCYWHFFVQLGRLWVGSMGHEYEPTKLMQEQGSLVSAGLTVHCKINGHVIIINNKNVENAGFLEF